MEMITRDLQFVANRTRCSIQSLRRLCAREFLQKIDNIGLSILDSARIVIEWRICRNDTLPLEITSLSLVQRLTLASLADLSGLNDQEFHQLTTFFRDKGMAVNLLHGRHLKPLPVMPMPDSVVSGTHQVDDSDSRAFDTEPTNTVDSSDYTTYETLQSPGPLDMKFPKAVRSAKLSQGCHQIMSVNCVVKPTYCQYRESKGFGLKADLVLQAVIDLHRIGVTAPTRNLVAKLVGYASAASSPFPLIIKKLEDHDAIHLARGTLKLVRDPSPMVWIRASLLHHLASMVASVMKTASIESAARVLDHLQHGASMTRNDIARSLGYKNQSSQPFSRIVTTMILLQILKKRCGTIEISSFILHMLKNSVEGNSDQYANIDEVGVATEETVDQGQDEADLHPATCAGQNNPRSPSLNIYAV